MVYDVHNYIISFRVKEMMSAFVLVTEISIDILMFLVIEIMVFWVLF